MNIHYLLRIVHAHKDRMSHQGLRSRGITTGAHSPVGGNLESVGWIGMNVDGTVGFHSEGATRDSARDRL
mgnify:CR=1 FL=1